MTVQVELVIPGTTVEYHGSLSQYHGEMEVHNFHFPLEQINGDDVIRYQLRYGPGYADYLGNVRLESFTVVGGPVTEDRHA